MWGNRFRAAIKCQISDSSDLGLRHALDPCAYTLPRYSWAPGDPVSEGRPSSGLFWPASDPVDSAQVFPRALMPPRGPHTLAGTETNLRHCACRPPHQHLKLDLHIVSLLPIDSGTNFSLIYMLIHLYVVMGISAQPRFPHLSVTAPPFFGGRSSPPSMKFWWSDQP